MTIGDACPKSQCLEEEVEEVTRALDYPMTRGKLRSRWDGPFVITNVFPYGAVELKDETTNNTFQINGHQIKNFHEVPTLILAHYKPKSQKIMINLNLRGYRSFGIVLGISLA
ncbi:hypothetical protein CR513_19270, partial [Mucuna pruriens]